MFGIEQEELLGVEIPDGQLNMFNEIFDKAHRTHGKSEYLTVAYAALLLENNSKGKTSSKCKVGHYIECYLDAIAPNYHGDKSYAFFKYKEKQ